MPNHWATPTENQSASSHWKILFYYCSTCTQYASNSIRIDWIWLEFQRVFRFLIAFEWILLLDSKFSIEFDIIIKYLILLLWVWNWFRFCLCSYLGMASNSEAILMSFIITNNSKMLILMRSRNSLQKFCIEATMLFTRNYAFPA